MKELLTIDEVCELAKVSKPTVYRRVKAGTFPKPVKVPSNAARGPNNVNRWKRAQVLGWLLKGNDPKWIEQPVKDIKAACAEVDKAPIKRHELAKDMKPGLNALFRDDQLRPDDVARRNDGTDIYDFEPVEEQKPNYTLMAIIGGMAAALAVWMFQ